ncbi:MAG: hypothetical protein GX957_13080 [Clostridiaceae bacterium]|nr:hypothetical protein [Clostridiaceae bacterium]
MNSYSVIGVVCIVLAVLMAVFAILTSRKQKSQKLKSTNKRNAVIFINLYERLKFFPLINELLINIRRRLEVYSRSGEASLRKQSVILLFTTVVMYLGLVLLFWFITKDIFMLLLFMVLLAFISDTIIEIFLTELYNKLLKQQIYYLELLRHKYYEQNSVEDANYESCIVLNQEGYFEIYGQAESINDILTSADSETELEKYYESAPNKYLKMLAGILYIIKEYGDTKNNGKSTFISCITYLGSEIKSDIYKREKLKYALKGMNLISVLPLFFLKPLRNWVSNCFVPLKNFYYSKLGIILGVITVIVTIICYMTLRRIQQDRSEPINTMKKSLDQKLYDVGLYWLVDKIVPHGYTVKGNRLIKLIKSAMVPMNLHILYTKRIITGFLAFIMGILLFLGLNYYTRYTILYEPKMPEGFLGGRLSDDELNKLQEITDFDRDIILTLDKKSDVNDIKEYITVKKRMNETEAQLAAQRIHNKILKLSFNLFWWWQLLLCIFFFVAGYYYPVISLSFMAKVRKIDMEEEVSQFHTIILMLKHMNRVHVEEILEWMETFSIHFKDPLQKCLSNFSSGHYEALEELKEDVAFPPFKKIIGNLQLACEDLGVKRAFEELENEMAFNRETRKESSEKIVERKKNLGNIIGFLPVYMMIILYLIIPMIVSGMESISAFYRQLSQM